MPTPTTTSPNVGNLQVGKGILSFKKAGSDTFRDLGNVSAMTLTPNLTTLDHFTSRAGTKLKDLTIILEKASTVKITMEEFTADNLALMLCGDADGFAVGGHPTVEIFSEDSITGELKFVGTNEVGPQMTVDLYNVSFTPSGDLNFISDSTFGDMETTADVLAATDGENVGKFGLVTFTNVAPGS